MCEIQIPGFKKCIIMSFNCVNCGAKSNEVRSAEPYGEKAMKMTLRVQSAKDLNREVLKADTAGVTIPEIDFEMCSGSLGGFFTTVEGLIDKMADNLSSSSPFVGDSSDPNDAKSFLDVIKSLRRLTSDPKALPFTLILNDPADHSCISSPFTNINDDPNLSCELYERTEEQNDDLGLSTMKVTDY